MIKSMQIRLWVSALLVGGENHHSSEKYQNEWTRDFSPSFLVKITNTSNVLKQLSNTQKKIVLLLIAPFIVLEISIAVSQDKKRF